MLYEVYLAGMSDELWRKEVKDSISKDIKIYDPFEHFNKQDLNDNYAKESYIMHERCALIAFYLNNKWQGAMSLLELGECTGKGKPVIACLENEFPLKERIERYCKYHGILVTYNIENFVLSIEEYIAELDMIVNDLKCI